MNELVRELLELKVNVLKMLNGVGPDEPHVRERLEKLCVAITETIKGLEQGNGE